MTNAGSPGHPVGPMKRLLDPAQPFCREDVIWALDYIKTKAAEKALQSSEPDQPLVCGYFACFAEMSLLLLNRQTPGAPEAARFRAMLACIYAERGI